MAAKEPEAPVYTTVWRYRRGEDGNVESKLFACPEDIPENEGWHDTPASIIEPGGDAPMPSQPVKRGPGRPKKVTEEA